MGERVLCKHEVVGSIPSGSTSLASEFIRNRDCGVLRERGVRELFVIVERKRVRNGEPSPGSVPSSMDASPSGDVVMPDRMTSGRA